MSQHKYTSYSAPSPEFKPAMPYFAVLKAKTRSASLPASSSLHGHPIRDLERYAICLPEPQRELYRKLFRVKLTTFTCFLDLPKELRLKIWRLTFPEGREIHMRVQYKISQGNENIRHGGFGLPPPIALSIHRESRDEGLRHFHMFSQDDAFHTYLQLQSRAFTRAPKVFCINPTLDKISIPFGSIFSINFTYFVEYMIKSNPKCMSKIRRLEVHGFYQTNHVLEADAYDHEMFNYCSIRGLMKFHNLKELYFIVSPKQNIQLTFAHSWKERITKCFEREKKLYPECQVPKITCMTWNLREAMRFLAGEHRP